MMSGGFEGGFAGGLVGPAAAVFAIFLDGRIVGEFEVGGKVGHGLFWLLTHDDWDMPTMICCFMAKPQVHKIRRSSILNDLQQNTSCVVATLKPLRTKLMDLSAARYTRYLLWMSSDERDGLAD